MELRTENVTRYIMPLREGGSLPTLAEADVREIVDLVPNDWLHWNDSPGTPQEIRDVYIRFLIDRIAHSDTFINEARHARQTLI